MFTKLDSFIRYYFKSIFLEENDEVNAKMKYRLGMGDFDRPENFF